MKGRKSRDCWSRVAEIPGPAPESQDQTSGQCTRAETSGPVPEGRDPKASAEEQPKAGPVKDTRRRMIGKQAEPFTHHLVATQHSAGPVLGVGSPSVWRVCAIKEEILLCKVNRTFRQTGNFFCLYLGLPLSYNYSHSGVI